MDEEEKLNILKFHGWVFLIAVILALMIFTILGWVYLCFPGHESGLQAWAIGVGIVLGIMFFICAMNIVSSDEPVWRDGEWQNPR